MALKKIKQRKYDEKERFKRENEMKILLNYQELLYDLRQAKC